MKKALYFNAPYLDPDDPKCTSSDYFKEISYFIDLNGKTPSAYLYAVLEIYKILDSPYYHAAMPYVPIFLRVGQE
jgi:hypothetical protein